MYQVPLKVGFHYMCVQPTLSPPPVSYVNCLEDSKHNHRKFLQSDSKEHAYYSSMLNIKAR
jgi:hypothetical protein